MGLFRALRMMWRDPRRSSRAVAPDASGRIDDKPSPHLVSQEPAPDAVDRSNQRVYCDAVAVEPVRRYATLGEIVEAPTMRGYIPAAFLAQKVKSVCDGILAALDRTARTVVVSCCSGLVRCLDELQEARTPQGRKRLFS